MAGTRSGAQTHRPHNKSDLMWGVRDLFTDDEAPTKQAVRHYVVTTTGREEPDKWLNELIGLARNQVSKQHLASR